MKILLALIKKEIKQILRDPSSIIIAFVLPFISIMIYMYGINLDSVKITMGIKNDDNSPEVATLVKSFGHSKYVNSINFDNMEDIIEVAKKMAKELYQLKEGDLIVVTGGFPLGKSRSTNLIRIVEI